jgi:hypothetical protein
MSVIDEVVLRMRTIGATTAAGEVAGVEKGIGSLGKTAKFAAGVAGIGALAFGLKDITEAAVSFQTQSRLTEQSLRNTHQYSAANLKQLTDYSDQLATHGGYDPTTTLGGLQRLVGAHLSVARAISDEHLATDIARSGFASHATAVRTLSIIEQGRTTGLGRLGQIIHPVTAAQDALTASHVHATKAMIDQAKAQDVQATKVRAMQVLWHRFRGQVEAFSGSPAGAISNFNHQIDILAQNLGKTLLPAINGVLIALTATVGWVQHAVEWFGKHRVAAVALGTALGTVAVSMWGMAAAEAAVNIAIAATNGLLILLTNIPIVALITAIAVGIYELVTHFKDVKQAAVDAFHWVVRAGEDAKNWLVGAWRTVAHAIAWPFVQAFHVIKTLYDNTIGPIIGAIKDIFGWATGVSGSVHYNPHTIGGSLGAHALRGRRAAGGPVYDSGMYLVGERGPEVVYIPSGGHVDANPSGSVDRGGHVKVSAPILNRIQIDSRTVLQVMNHAVAYGQAVR